MGAKLRLARCGLIVAAVCLWGARAHADTTANQRRALELFESSVTAYDQRRFADAIALLRQAYALEKEPVLLYNLGRAYEGQGDLEAAATAYEQFLAAQPDAPDRASLEQRIGALRRDNAQRKALSRPTSEAPRKASPVPWIIAGAGVSGLVAGGLFGGLAQSRHDDAVAESAHARAATLQSQATSFATVANVCVVAGGVLVAAGVLWGILDLSTPKKSALAAGVVTF